MFTAGTANNIIMLTSTLDGRQTACPGEMVTYTCIAPRTTVVSWFALPDVDGVDYFPSSQVREQVIGDFRIALINPLNTEFFSLEISFSLNMPLTHRISICVKALTPKLSPTPLVSKL